jgi:serine-type D-Ala-D-Ala carboxypeptidase/endopeptidase (penicillin-binding protein 4)
LIDRSTGKVILENNRDTPLAPASTLKTFTTAMALKELGVDFRFQTKINFKGKIQDGLAIGELIVIGSGDPSLGSDRFKETKPELVKQQIGGALRRLGANKFNGKITVIEHIFNDEAINKSWLAEDIGNYYGAGVYSLNWKENKFEINLVPTKTSFEVSSNNAGYDNKNDFCIELVHKDEATTEEAFAYIEKVKPCMYSIKGVLSNKEKISNMQLARLHPGKDFARELKDYLKKEFEFKEVNEIPQTKEILLTVVQSPPLSQLVYWCNQKSLNLYAESFCKTIAAKHSKKGSWKDGIYFMIKNAILDKINMKSVYLKDGSDLSVDNRITTHILAQLLYQDTKEKFFKTFYESLPSMNGLIMKSGYIGGTRSYAGYITLKDGREACFAFIINNYDCKPKEVKLSMYRLLDLLK